MNNQRSPCLGCAKRTMTCHDPKVCEEWAKYKDRCAALLDAIDRSRQMDEDARAVRSGRGKRRHYNHV